MPTPLASISLDDLAAVTGGHHSHHQRPTAPGGGASALPVVSPEPPAAVDPGLLTPGRTARSFRPNSPV